MRNTKNSCPVCGQETKKDELMEYCKDCGFNLSPKDHNGPKPKPGTPFGIDEFSR
jgi:predicted amidophosphoribosyltransferase